MGWSKGPASEEHSGLGTPGKPWLFAGHTSCSQARLGSTKPKAAKELNSRDASAPTVAEPSKRLGKQRPKTRLGHAGAAGRLEPPSFTDLSPFFAPFAWTFPGLLLLLGHFAGGGT